MHKYATLAALGLAAVPANGFFLMPCWPVSTQRIDPIVDPGVISSHVHQIAGGSAFSPNMTYSDTQAANCTTCFVTEDHSNYWVPAMYMHYENGSFERVNQVGSASMYYFNEATRLGAGEKMEPFPKGLRMLAGDPDKRSAGTDFASQAINYKCLDYAGQPTDSKTFPPANCPDGVRAEVTYPSCWDGTNLDSSDHKSHMAYPTGTFESGACPSTHPHHLVTLKVEFIFDTNSFKDQWYGSSQPFVWASGDSTGYGLHADYVMGWDYDLLSSAVAECFDEYGVLANCAPFSGKIQSAYVNPGTCKVDSFVDEDVGGTLEAMPGCNAVSSSTSTASNATCNEDVKMIGDWSNSGAASSSDTTTDTESGTSNDSSDDDSAAAASSSYYITVIPIYSQTSGSESTAAPVAASPVAASPQPASPSPSPSVSTKSQYQWSALPDGYFSQSSSPPSPVEATTSAAPTGWGNAVTVTNVQTETTYTTEKSKFHAETNTADAVVATSPHTAPAAASPTASAASESHGWGVVRREIGDDMHKHQMRHLKYRRRAALKAEHEQARAFQPEY